MHVALFVTCLIDHMRPQAAHATIALLQQAGCRVDVPLQQTCCGQPAYNNGDTDDARELARHTIRILEDYDYVVIPSGSCAGMLILHYPQLFDAEPEWHSRALALARNCYELTRFLHEVVEYIPTARCDLRLSYHDSCSCRRELGILEQPRELLRRIDGVELLELDEQEVCCGFGGTFAVSYPEVSTRMVSNKTASVRDSGATVLASADLGCLLNIAGRLSREGSPVRVFHIAEVLAGTIDEPAIGEEAGR